MEQNLVDTTKRNPSVGRSCWFGVETRVGNHWNECVIYGMIWNCWEGKEKGGVGGGVREKTLTQWYVNPTSSPGGSFVTWRRAWDILALGREARRIQPEAVRLSPTFSARTEARCYLTALRDNKIGFVEFIFDYPPPPLSPAPSFPLIFNATKRVDWEITLQSEIHCWFQLPEYLRPSLFLSRVFLLLLRLKENIVIDGIGCSGSHCHKDNRICSAEWFRWFVFQS